MNKFEEMPHCLPDGSPECFSPKDYFLGVALHALASEHDTQVSLPELGEITLFPARGAYHAAVSDMQAFCQAHASKFRITVLKGTESEPVHDAQSKRPLAELLWQAAFHASQGRLVESYANGETVRIVDVIKFRRWPNLTRLPTTPNTMRICALLTRNPSSLLLVSRKLGIEQQEAFQVFSAACSAGIAHVAFGPKTAVAQDDLHRDLTPQRQERLLNSLFNKIIRM